MTKLVEDIIDLTRLDAGGEEYVFESCDLLRIAENAVDSLETEAAGANVTLALKGVSAPMQGVPQLLHSIVHNLSIEVPDEVLMVPMDATLIRQVIMNLLENAAIHGGNVTQIRVCLSREGTNACFAISDNGVGIPKDSQSRIFERFYRVDKSRSKAVGGTGLGLSIVKHAALLQKADVRVESEPGEGSTFTVTFPEK